MNVYMLTEGTSPTAAFKLNVASPSNLLPSAVRQHPLNGSYSMVGCGGVVVVVLVAVCVVVVVVAVTVVDVVDGGGGGINQEALLHRHDSHVIVTKGYALGPHQHGGSTEHRSSAEAENPSTACCTAAK